MAIDIEQIQQIRSRTLEALRALEGSVWREVQGELHAQYREIPTWILLYEDSDLDGKEIKPGDKWDMGHKPGYENIMTQPSEENRELARYIISIFGGRPGVREYFDDQKVATIDILTAKHGPLSQGEMFTWGSRAANRPTGQQDRKGRCGGADLHPSGIRPAEIHRRQLHR